MNRINGKRYIGLTFSSGISKKKNVSIKISYENFSKVTIFDKLIFQKQKILTKL